MSSAKTERLVNLTMALLATPRYLQKSEIFRKVSGYSGSQDTKERMFERDKDDLRSLGIEIEVASHDPLFEDEPGYRIKREKFQLPIEKFSNEELSVLSTALGLWSNTGLSSLATNTIRRLGTDDAQVSTSLKPAETELLSEDALVDLSQSLSNRSTVTFEYTKSGQISPETRRVNPLGLSAWHGSWYLVGEDLDRKDIRVFKTSRITSRIEVSSKRGSYEIPSDFGVRDYLIMYSKDLIEIQAFVRKGSAHEIRARAISHELTPESLTSEWELITFQSESKESALREALWFSDVVVVKEPKWLRQEIVAALEKVAANHG